ncbi:hypothetical protein [Streptomyces sp. NPDC055299]
MNILGGIRDPLDAVPPLVLEFIAGIVETLGPQSFRANLVEALLCVPHAVIGT